MDDEKILDNITKSVNDRLKIPIIITYISVLVIYNWDILYYLFFEDGSASLKIDYIKQEYCDEYYWRILNCLLISTGLIVLFTILNTSLNYCLKWFYKKDKEITSEIENFEKIELLTQQLSNSVDEIKKLESQVSNLENINQSLAQKKLNISVSDISKADMERLIAYLNSFENKEKLLFSLKELITNLNANSNFTLEELYTLSTYKADMQLLINILRERELVDVEERLVDGRWEEYLDLSPSFRDFLNIEI